MSELLSIREAARRLGVSTDTLRQWERDKRLTAERTEGGHRRFRLEDIERLQRRKTSPAPEVPASPGTPTPSPTAASPTTSVQAPHGEGVDPFWQTRLKDVRARLEIRRLRREAVEQQAEIDRRRAAAQLELEAQRRHEAHRRRLSELKAYGRDLARAWVAAEERAEVIREIEEYVSPQRFPAELPAADAHVLVQAHVRAALTRLDKGRAERAARQERERRRVNERLQLDRLVASGLTTFRRETVSWETVDQLRALRDVEGQLREEVRPDWSYAQVEALVSEIVSEFEDAEEGDEDDMEDDEE